MCDDVKFNYVYHLLKNATKKIQHRSKVNYVKILFVERVSSQTQQSSKFCEQDETTFKSQYIFIINSKPKNISKKLRKNLKTLQT